MLSKNIGFVKWWWDIAFGCDGLLGTTGPETELPWKEWMSSCTSSPGEGQHMRTKEVRVVSEKGTGEHISFLTLSLHKMRSTRQWRMCTAGQRGSPSERELVSLREIEWETAIQSSMEGESGPMVLESRHRKLQFLNILCYNPQYSIKLFKIHNLSSSTWW